MRAFTIVGAVLLGATVGALAMRPAQGQVRTGERQLQGGARAAEAVETYRMTTDVRRGAQRAKRPQLQKDRRHLIHVPEFYGEVFEITAHGDDAVMWFKADDGVVRSAIVPGVADGLVRVQAVEATGFDVSFR